LPSDKQPLESVMNLQQLKKLLSLQEIAISHPGCSIDFILRCYNVSVIMF
jgi:hypothetical protein